MSLLADYVALGWALVPIPKGKKGPTWKGWNKQENCHLPDGWRGNVGLAHAYSGTCAIDFDDLEKGAAELAKLGIDALALLEADDAVQITSGRPNRAKLLYRLATPLASKKLFGGAIELRCAASTGATVQDVLPPSIHPDTEKPYEWRFGLLAGYEELPLLPESLLKLWQDSINAPGDASAEPPASGGVAAPPGAIPPLPDPDCDYDTWLRVGMAFHHRFQGDLHGLDLWDAWSANGTKYKGRDDLTKHWRSFKLDTPNPVTFDSLRAITPAALDEFDVIEEPAPRAAGARFRNIPAAEFARGAAPSWIVDGLLPRAELAVIYGESGSGKSFFALDLVAAISRGVPWRDLDVEQGRVVYVVAEGVGGFRSRLRAYAQQEDCALESLPDVVTDTPNLLEKQDALALAREILRGGPVAVIVVDTLSATTPGANENSGEDMGAVIAHCKGLHRATGALVALIHHSGKDATKGARGWSGLRAAADVELEVTRASESLSAVRTVRVSKQKDGEDGGQFAFTLAPLVLGHDGKGRAVTSCVVQPAVIQPRIARQLQPRGNVQRNVFKLIQDMAPPNGGDLAVKDVIDRAVAEMPHDGETGPRDMRRRAALRAIEGLAASGFILTAGDRLSLA